VGPDQGKKGHLCPGRSGQTARGVLIFASSSHLDDELAAVLRKATVVGQQMQWLAHRLREQQAVERIGAA
jgi:hypothetical protein